MVHFDPGYCSEPFLTLVDQPPGASVYDPKHFRVEWGPIFHRGRLDGSARVLVIGQDPAAHETFVRRILVGEAGSRIQGFLAKLGLTRSYVMINTFVYSVYDSAHDTPAMQAYRKRWIDALLGMGKIEAVVTLGTAAHAAWDAWVAKNTTITIVPHHEAITHPTEPESAHAHDHSKTVAGETQKLLANWNAALKKLAPLITHRDITPLSTMYAGSDWQPGDRVEVPSFDVPAGLPSWMRTDGWAVRAGDSKADARPNLTLTVPVGVI